MLPRKSDGQVKFPKIILPIRQTSDEQNTQTQLENPLTPGYKTGLSSSTGSISDNTFSGFLRCHVHHLVSGVKFILSTSNFDIVITHSVQKLSCPYSFPLPEKLFNTLMEHSHKINLPLRT